MGRRFTPSLFIVAVLAGSAVAEPKDTVFDPNGPMAEGGPRQVVIMPHNAFTQPDSVISPYLYLNRCKGGCTVIGSNTNDARTNQSAIAGAGSHQMGEFALSNGMISPAS